MHLGNPCHTYVRKNLREASVKVRDPSEHLYEDIQLSVQHRDSLMTDIDGREIFIATFIATFIVPFDENPRKPNIHQGLSSFTTPIDFRICYENCESIVRFAKLPKRFTFAENKNRSEESYHRWRGFMKQKNNPVIFQTPIAHQKASVILKIPKSCKS